MSDMRYILRSVDAMSEPKRFRIKIIKDENEYITDVIVNDNWGVLGKNHHPLRLDISELLQLYDAIKPIVEEIRSKWEKKGGSP
jgi:hypothetical protein